jgi:hypothetical protein
MVPAQLLDSVSLEPLKKSDIESISQVGRHGRMVSVVASILGVQMRQKTPPEVTLCQLVRRNPTLTTMPPETVFSWGRTTAGAPERLQDGDVIEIQVGTQVVSRCIVYLGMGQFAAPFEMNVVARGEAELLAEANRLNPRIGLTPQYYQGVQKLPNLTPAAELLIFPQEIERTSMDSPTETGITAEKMRRVGPMKTIKWTLTDRAGKDASEAVDAVVPEDVTLIQLWLECVKVKYPDVESSRIEWGRQAREGVDIGHGMPLTIQDGDRLHIKCKSGKKVPAGGRKQQVDYVIRKKDCHVTMRGGDSIEKLLNEIRKLHKSVTIERIRSEDRELQMTMTLADRDSGVGG